MVKIAYILAGGAVGGAERYVADLIAHLDRDRFRPCVLGHTTGPVSRLAEYGVQVFPILASRVHYLIGILRLTRRLRKERPDIVHTHDNRANFLGRIAARWAGSPAVLSTVHTSPVRTGRRDVLNRVYLAADRWSARYADLMIGTSDFLRDQIVRYLRVPRDRALTVYPGVDMNRFHPERFGRIREKKDGAFRVAVVGRLELERRHEVVLEVAARVVQRLPDMEMHILGDGTRRQYLEALTERLGLAEKVILWGHVDDVPSYLSRMDLMVSAAEREGFGIALAEAMAMGIPVVAVDIGGVSELVRDGVNGVLVPEGDWGYMADVLVDLARDRERTRKMGAAGRRFVAERFRVEDMAGRMMRAYEGCVRRQT